MTGCIAHGGEGYFCARGPSRLPRHMDVDANGSYEEGRRAEDREGRANPIFLNVSYLAQTREVPAINLYLLSV